MSTRRNRFRHRVPRRTAKRIRADLITTNAILSECTFWNRNCTAGNGAQSQLCDEKVAMRKCIVLFLLFSSCMAWHRINAQTVSDLSTDSGSSSNSSSAGAPDPAGADSRDWLFPVDKLNQSLPRWFYLGGEYRGRLEGPTGIGFTSTNDFY